jgi:archaellin
MSDVAWSQTFIGTNNGDDLLEDGEEAEITVWLMDRATATAAENSSSIGYTDGNSGNGGSASGLTSTDTLVVKSTRFVLELTPQLGAPLTVQRAIPPGLRNVMNLN